jgi:hypothetical protein
MIRFYIKILDRKCSYFDYCRIGCGIQFFKGSGAGKQKIFMPFSNCQYFFEFKLGPAATSVKSNPSTNRPVECELC